MNEILTVSQLSNYLKIIVDSDNALKQVTIKGEIGNFTNHLKSGHFYFTLKDKSASIKVVMFKNFAQSVPFEPSSGMRVLASGSIRVFERDCVVQLYCEQLQPDGIGALFLAFEQLKEKLTLQGLFDVQHKRPIPTFPRKIGVVTSKTGAAFQDILNVLSRRYPIGTVTLIPALVQGDDAPKSICEAISLAPLCPDIDVLIVGRGGGSIEDLWSFNNENVAIAIYNSKIPVISAVGHEVDFTIADFVADLRAPTPSVAAELCAPDIADLMDKVAMLGIKASRELELLVLQRSDKLYALKKRIKASSPLAQLEKNAQNFDKLTERFFIAADKLYMQKIEKLAKQVSLLEALSPLKVISRGYSITLCDEKVVTRVSELQIGDFIKTKLSDGETTSKVTEKVRS